MVEEQAGLEAPLWGGGGEEGGVRHQVKHGDR